MKRYLSGMIAGFALIGLAIISNVDAAKEIDVSRFNVEMKIIPDSKTREKTCLNGEWDFYPVEGIKEYKPPQEIPKDVKWEKIIVPSDWKSTTLGYGEVNNEWWHVSRGYDYPARWFKCPAAWYKREIMVPKDMKNRRVILDFGGVFHWTWVYVNGKFTGEHEDMTPFKIDITDFIKFGESNEIYVYVIDTSVAVDKALKQASHYQALYDRAVFFKSAYAGIWQDINLEIVPEIYTTEDIWITTSFRKKEIKVQANLCNRTKEDENINVKVLVLDNEKKEVFKITEEKIKIGANVTIEKEFTSKWENPKLWTTETPNLYYLKLEIFKDNKLIDERYERFGFREFWCEGKNFMLNGRKFYLWSEGGNAFTSTLDYALRPEIIRSVFRRLKSLGTNHIREWSMFGGIAPYYAFDIADEEGIMMQPMVEVAHYPLSVIPNAKEIVAGRIKAKRNHPSVILWQSEGEAFDVGGKQWKEDIKELTKVIMETDPTLPVTGDAGEDYEGMLPVVNWHYPNQNGAWARQIRDPFGWAKSINKPIYLGETFYMGKWVECGTEIERWFGDYITYMRYDLWPERYYEMYTSIPKVERSYGVNLMILGSGRSEYILPYGAEKEYKFNWGDYTKSYLKPKHIIPFVNPGYLSDKPEITWDKRFDILKDIESPLAVTIWREWDHNFVSGTNVEKGIWVFNHTMEDKSDLKVRYRLENSGISNEIYVSKVPQGETIEIGKIKFNAPIVKERTEYKLVVELIKGSEIINQDMMSIHIYPEPSINKSVLKTKKIFLYDTNAKKITSKILDNIGVEYQKYEAGKTELNKNIDLLIIGYESVDMDIEDDNERVSKYMSDGGKVLIFEQSGVNRVSRSTGFISAPAHPIFKGISQDRFYLWRGEDEVTRFVSLLPEKGMHRSLVTIGGKGHLGEANLTSPDIFSVLLEKIQGKGIMLTCNLLVSNRYGIDPEATILVNNILEYLVTLPENKENKVGYIGKNSDKNILKNIKADYKDIEIKDIGNYDIVVIGEKEIKEDLEIVANKDKINEFVKKGGVVLCLSQESDNWTDKWLPEKIELRKFPKITRALCNANEFTYGTRRVLFEPKKRNSNANIFNNHFVFENTSKWQKIIESCVLKEQMDTVLGYRSIHEPSGGSMVAELKEGKGKYILCQIPYDSVQNQWINEAIVQLMTNIGIPRQGKEKEKLQKTVAKSRLTTEKDWVGYFSVNIRQHCNMFFKDEVDGDKQGGWTDQGANDMRYLQTGNLVLGGKPFKIIDPYDTIDIVAQKSCIVLRDAKYRTYFPKEVKGISVDKKAKELVFLHCDGWGIDVEDGGEVGKYVVTYDDGTKVDIPIRHNIDLGSWWPMGFDNTKPVKGDLVWLGKNEMYPSANVGLYKFIWNNPNPDKKIKTIDMASFEKQIIILVAITGKD